MNRKRFATAIQFATDVIGTQASFHGHRQIKINVAVTGTKIKVG